MRLWFLIALLALSYQNAAGQSTGDYRTAGTGDWNNAATWQRFDGVTWVAAATYPTSTAGAIAIRNNHTITIPVGVSITVDQLTLNYRLIVDGIITLADGAGTDLIQTVTASLVVVNGIFVRTNGSTIDNQDTASRLRFNAASEYRHQHSTSVGTLPAAQWNAASTVTLTFANAVAITATDNSWSQTLGHVTYNSPNQTALVDFAGMLTTVTGDLRIVNTGTNVVQFSDSQNLTLDVAGEFTTTGSARFNLSVSGIATMNVQGNFTYLSSIPAGSYLTHTGTSTLNIAGDFTMNATANGRIRLGNAGTTGNSTINFQGNFLLLTGRIEEVGSNPTQGSLRFLGNGTRTYVNGGYIVGYINTYISPQTTLDIGTSPITGASPAAFVLEGTLIVGSLDALGAIQNSSTRGNIRTAATYRTYAAGSTIIYGGAGAQFIGSGHPTTADITTAIDNPAGVTLASAVTINGALSLRSGSLNLGDTYLLTLAGTVARTSGSFGGTSLSKMTIAGTTGGSVGTLFFNPAANHVGTLTLNRTGANAGVTLNSTLHVGLLLNLNNGIFTNTSGLAMDNHATITRYNTSSLAGAEPIATGTYNVTYRTATVAGGPYASINAGPELPSAATALGDLTIYTNQAQESVNLTQATSVNGTVTLTRGTLNAGAQTLTMQGPSWVDNSGNFAAGTGTVIFNGTTSVGGASSTTFNDIELASGKSLTLTVNTTINGDITFAPDAIFSMGTTIVTFGGAAAQTVSAGGATFSNINVTKSGGAGVQLTSTLNLTGLLQFVSPSSNVTVASNGNLVVRSTTDAPGGTNGSIYRLLSGNTISGDVTVERYMSPEGRIYRYLSSPVTNAMVAQWKDDFPITGKFQDPSPTQTICGDNIRSNAYSMYRYDETATGNVDAGYVGYPLVGTSTTNSPLETGKGYAAYIRECTVPTVVDVTGPINQGTITFPVTYTATPDVDANGWNLIGNPYPATIDWDVSGWTRTRMSVVIAIVDNGTGMMRYYEAGVTNDIPNGQIAPSQAFFVRATGASPVLRLTESVKVTPVAEFFRERAPIEIPSFAVVLSDGQRSDAAYVKVQDAAQPGLDSLDAPKLYNLGGFSFSTLAADDRAMAINAVSALTCNTVFPLEMMRVEAGSYNIALTTKVINGYHFMLTDKYLGKTVELKSGTYAFTIDENEASKDPHRFSVSVADDALAGITIESPAVVDAASAEHTVQVSGTTSGVSYTLVNAAGTLIAGPVQGTGAAISFQLPVEALQDGTNELSINSLGGCSPEVFKTSFEVLKAAREGINGEQGAVLVSAYPNPVADQLTLHIVDSDVRSIQVTTTMGQVISSVPVVAGQSNYTIDASAWGSGLYLMVVDKNSIKKSYRLIKK